MIILNKNIKNDNNNEENQLMDNKLNELPKLNENTKEKLSEENFYLYNKIIEFLSDEYKSLNIKINNIKNASIINNQIYSLKESIYYAKYKNLFTNIYNKENEKSKENKEIVIIKKKELDKIKNECNILFNNINSGFFDLDNINEKFEKIFELINNYKNNKLYNNNNKNNDKNLYNIDNINNKLNLRNDFNQKKEVNSLENIKKNDLFEGEKENKSHRNFIGFYNSYNIDTLSSKINNSFTHNFFNFKKNNADIQFRIISSELL